MNKEAQIKAEAARLGFMSCGISRVRFLEEEAPRLEAWLNAGHHGSMAWMENHFDKRLDPSKLVPGAQTVVSVLLNYYPAPKDQQDPNAPKISKYAWGTDYHYVIKEKLAALLDFIQQHFGQVEGRAFVDSAPVMDRAWAKAAGLGWIGKHSLLLTKGAGSFFFIGELIIDLKLEPDTPTSDHCGTCTKCIDACPTAAILQPQVVDSNRCISHMTIELRDNLPTSAGNDLNNWLFGCDICQDVCPWNRFSSPHREPKFTPTPGLLEMSHSDWLEITNSVFKKTFRSSPLKRAGLKKLQNSITIIQNSKEQKNTEAMEERRDF
ncbi:MAG: tRNA epoxyqueuosine(34) reductase QueG [Schleiferiaceae bacterium]|nr:tRNA epoxyqueuosine(34) reductase QueG [Schleiferiaceae bacterium]